MLQLLYHLIKLSTPPFLKKFFKHLMKHITLLTYLLPCPTVYVMYQSRIHDVEELLDIWHGLQQSAVDS